MTLSITPLYAGILGLMLIALSLRIVRMRRRERIGIGDGENRQLLKAIRVHGNFTEFVPTALILLMLLEFNQASPALLHGCGAALCLGRLLHAVGLSKSSGSSAPRFAGSGLTWTAIGVMAIANLIKIFTA